MFSAKRDTVAAQAFFEKAHGAPHGVAPRVINVDKNAACPKAETMNMIRKGQVKGAQKGDIPAHVELINSLFGIAA